MRSTLIFKGVPEENNEGYEKYEKTSSILANLISTCSEGSISVNEVTQNIDRAHRSSIKANTNEYENANDEDGSSKKTNKPRHIFVKFVTWKSAMLYQKTIATCTTKGKVFVEQMHSQNVTKRRNEALLERKELISGGSKDKMFVAYPAKLMSKSPNELKYRMIKEF